nr:protein ACCELERATED CELL DEATH 6-like [Ipomoea trifida]
MTDDSGWTPLHYAIKNQYSETARIILAERSCSAYICVGKGNKWTTAFHIAARYGNVGMIEYMSNNFPDCWIMLKCKSQNVLHETVLGHSLNAIDYILKYPQIDNLIAGKDEDGKTPVAFLLSSCRDLGTILWNVLLCSDSLRTHAGLLTGEIRAQRTGEVRHRQGQSDRATEDRGLLSPES